MGRVKCQLAISLDGYAAGPNQSLDEPLGVGGEELHRWVFDLEAWRGPQGLEGGITSPSTQVVKEAQDVGATVGIASALEQAQRAAGDRDVLIAGGANAVQQYLAAGLIEELQLHIVPLLLGDGERLLENVGDLRLEQTRVIEAPEVVHLTYRVKT